MSETLAAAPPTWQTRIVQKAYSLDRRSLFVCMFILATLSFLPYQFWKQPSIVDRANWDYFAQVIARGGVPYRDVVNIKSPLSSYIGAAAIVAATPLGLRDIFAIRIVYLLLASLTAGLTFIVAHDYFNSRRVAVIAGVLMMAFNLFGDANCGGVQPKTPMIVFGLISLWAIQKDRPLTAGLAGMLSALSWQPGLLFVGVAGLAFSRYLTSWRDLRAFKVIAGAAVPLAIFLAYFWVEGALRDVYRWNIEYNLTVDAPRGLRTLPQLIDRFARLMKGAFRAEWFYFVISVFGFATAVWRELRINQKARVRGFISNAPRHSVFIAPIVYFVFCTINIQSGVDLIPILPFVAIFAAVAIVSSIDWIGNRLFPAKPLARTNIGAATFAGALALILIFSVGDVLLVRVPFPTLKDQDAEVAEISSHLRPGDQIYVHGVAEILVLARLTNADKHFFLDRGKDTYLDRVEPGGFAGWLDRLKSRRPRVVAIERTKFVEHREDFVDWVRADYEEHKGRIFTYYVLKDAD